MGIRCDESMTICRFMVLGTFAGPSIVHVLLFRVRRVMELGTFPFSFPLSSSSTSFLTAFQGCFTALLSRSFVRCRRSRTEHYLPIYPSRGLKEMKMNPLRFKCHRMRRLLDPGGSPSLCDFSYLSWRSGKVNDDGIVKIDDHGVKTLNLAAEETEAHLTNVYHHQARVF